MHFKVEDTEKKFSSKEDRIAAQLEQILSDIVKAVNTRSFDPESHPWTSIADDFTFAGAGSLDGATGKTGHIENLRQTAYTFPSFRVEILSMETQVYRSSGYAEVYMNALSTGGSDVPQGWKMKTVGVHEFRRMDCGRWMKVGQTTFTGVGDGLKG